MGTRERESLEGLLRGSRRGAGWGAAGTHHPESVLWRRPEVDRDLAAWARNRAVQVLWGRRRVAATGEL